MISSNEPDLLSFIEATRNKSRFLTSPVSNFLGLAQCSELCWQLRGLAEKRQVPGARLALQHNIGLGGAAVVALYRLGFPNHNRYVKSN